MAGSPAQLSGVAEENVWISTAGKLRNLVNEDSCRLPAATRHSYEQPGQGGDKQASACTCAGADPGNAFIVIGVALEEDVYTRNPAHRTFLLCVRISSLARIAIPCQLTFRINLGVATSPEASAFQA